LTCITQKDAISTHHRVKFATWVNRQITRPTAKRFRISLDPLTSAYHKSTVRLTTHPRLID
jgi:hypothetical protein